MDNRADEEAVAGVGHTSEGVVPRGERAQKTEQTTSHDELRVGLAVYTVHVANTEQQESDVKEKENGEEGHS